MDGDGLSQLGDNIPIIIFMAVCVLLSAYFSATETAFFSMNKIRMKALVNEGNKRAEKALDIAEDLDSLLSTVLIGNNLVNMACSSMATVLFIRLLGQDIGPTIATIVITACLLYTSPSPRD